MENAMEGGEMKENDVYLGERLRGRVGFREVIPLSGDAPAAEGEGFDNTQRQMGASLLGDVNQRSEASTKEISNHQYVAQQRLIGEEDGV